MVVVLVKSNKKSSLSSCSKHCNTYIKSGTSYGPSRPKSTRLNFAPAIIFNTMPQIYIQFDRNVPHVIALRTLHFSLALGGILTDTCCDTTDKCCRDTKIARQFDSRMLCTTP